MRNQQKAALLRLISATSETEAYEAAIEVLGELLPSPTMIFSVDEDQLVRRATAPPTFDVAGRGVPLSETTILHAFESNAAEVIDDMNKTRSAAVSAETTSQKPFRSALVVPIADWGVILSVDEAPLAYDPETVGEVKMVAAIMAAVLELSAADFEDTDDVNFEELVAMVLGHDLKNPLNVAHGNLSLARETGEMDRLQKVKTALERIEELTEGLVRFTRTGNCLKERSPIELKPVAQRAWEMVEPKDDTQILIESTSILADPSLLSELLENLFSNAVEHGGDLVTVRVGPLEDDHGFFVEDDGTGIAEGDQETVLIRGYSTEDDHSGVGLQIVSDIADTHGWDLEVTESTSGGARFEFSKGL